MYKQIPILLELKLKTYKNFNVNFSEFFILINVITIYSSTVSYLKVGSG